MKPSTARLDPSTGCWLWVGELRDGYGVIVVGKRRLSAHRVLWEAENGKLPEKVQLDHLCRRRNCVRLAHLEPVSVRENSRRTLARHRRAILHCPENHLLAEHGIGTPEGGRVCRICSGV